MRPAAVPATVSEALVRLQAELTVEGFDAQVTEVDLGTDVRASLERMAPTMAATALVAVVEGADPASAELWVVDWMTGKTVVRRVHADPKAARIAEVLSVRAVELLRASFLELAITSRPAPDVVEVPMPTAPVVTRFVNEPLEEAEPDWTWAVEAGGGGVGAMQGVSGGTTLLGEFLPVARVQRAFNARWCARITFAGLGTQAHVDMPGGYADVSQTIGLLEALVRFRRGRRLEPVISDWRRLPARIGGRPRDRRRTSAATPGTCRPPAMRASASGYRCASGGSSWASRSTRSSPSPIRSSDFSRWRSRARAGRRCSRP